MAATPVVCIVGKKKSGKTTFIEALIPELKALGLSVGTVKHDAHSFDMDVEGKDTWRHRKAGSETVVISSPTQVAVIKSVNDELWLDELADQFFADRHIVVAEGYYNSDHPKIEVHRSDAHAHPLCDRGNEADRRCIAMVSDVGLDTDLPVFALDEAKQVAALIARRTRDWAPSGMRD